MIKKHSISEHDRKTLKKFFFQISNIWTVVCILLFLVKPNNRVSNALQSLFVCSMSYNTYYVHTFSQNKRTKQLALSLRRYCQKTRKWKDSNSLMGLCYSFSTSIPWQRRKQRNMTVCWSSVMIQTFTITYLNEVISQHEIFCNVTNFWFKRKIKQRREELDVLFRGRRKLVLWNVHR